ncbi:ATPase, T2SS/T4P/T4SS family [Candidatus Mesenet endosymbiont of Agriotes lineatus]|uniref:ATPase, T2SS/T4P/T4SS family n=1 Tax=Candidatus Mesenet endosymbiont of Agriotes lineatus TaxID=3077948 RepID=UPI0030CDA72B
MVNLDKLLSIILQNKNVSDIYFFENSPPIIREFNEIIFLQIPSLSTTEIKDIITILFEKDLGKKGSNETDQETKDFTFDFDANNRLRVHICNSFNQSSIVIHVLKPNSTSLNIPENFYQIIGKEVGLVLIAGPINSGKTITALHILNQIQNKHILIFDKKHELGVKSDKSLISYCNTTLEIRRKSPDIILFHDIDDDKRLIETAINCLQDGFLVIASLSALSFKDAIAKMVINKNNTLRVLSEYITAVMFQVLIKKKDCLGSLAVYDLFPLNTVMKNHIINADIKQLPNLNINNIINDLVKKEILDYTAADKTLTKLGYGGLDSNVHNLKQDDAF